MHEELEYTIKQQERTINDNAERVAKLMLQMQAHIIKGDYVAAYRMLGTYNISGDIENLTTALARYDAFLQIRYMMEDETPC
jgi:hypothetical protein